MILKYDIILILLVALFSIILLFLLHFNHHLIFIFFIFHILKLDLFFWKICFIFTLIYFQQKNLYQLNQLISNNTSFIYDFSIYLNYLLKYIHNFLYMSIKYNQILFSLKMTHNHLLFFLFLLMNLILLKLYNQN
jgi:hypothetical protein